MSNIILKINDSKETIRIVDFNTDGKNAVRIAAQANVNYEFVDQATGYGPENIMTKRVGQDLYIAFEGEDIATPDLIIENYYAANGEIGYADGDSNLLVGLHENGNYYAYVPESGQLNDAVSMLAEEMFAGQALGGTEASALAAALWCFNPWWLVGSGCFGGWYCGIGSSLR
ncbi:hypothetical protein [Neisseria perflava]|uniref:hypothetical protein n=1 Tax=Neisseria perflava TaxID=33053 RepID=UPI00209E58F7|nr:hypothetical protein [Neisseria perflava]MCP1660375.1 hypothetical protein [Neisseria perflava]